MTKLTDKVVCPTCGKKNTWISENSFRPFCSERCRLIDLGEWASEKYRVPLDEEQISNEDSKEKD